MLCERIRDAHVHARTLAIAARESTMVLRVNGVWTALLLRQAPKSIGEADCIYDGTGQRWSRT